jgi:hypothetical protein
VRIQQAEDWNLRERSVVVCRQALRRTVASVPRRDRLVGILVLLLTATGLLVTPTFGDSREEIREYRLRMRLEMLKRGEECKSAGTLNQIKKCREEVSRIYEEYMQKPGTCGAIEEPPNPVPVSCLDGYTSDSQGNCVRKCNSEKFRGCLAESTKAFERVYEGCRGEKAGIITDETEIRKGSPAYDFMISIGSDSASTARELLLEYFVKGNVDIVRGSYAFLVGAALETYKLLESYPKWNGDLNQCLDLADKVKTFVDDDCAKQAGCWPGQ